ncbi:methyltransferase domain-containing protein [Lacinutrix venerupis]|uniref:Methyltransferase type 11 n=1 Tax=Lacinutrix venerupis TaxID=1486034 RepID=A0AAC9LJ60_9FLAO|nr:methyltransferase domain-containing protein [Lacinutrix venerupis]APX99388.1 methyltransferase type 11 [Lacinutrix venerupis]
MELKRKKFQGVLNILSFNRHFYIYGLLALTLITTLFLYFNWPLLILKIIMLAFLYGLLMPLIISAYVYDYSGYYNFNWLKKYNLKDSKNQLILNINAGFDETSFSIKEKFPLSKLQVYDFYNSNNHTEPAIVRARKVTNQYPNTKQISTTKIPLKDNCVDVIFLLSAAHEIRSNLEKIQFLKECDRVCKTNGKIIIVEHLRDIPNFFAFSIGFTHFFSKKTWINVIKKAGFNTILEHKFTPFMSVFSFNN